MKKWLGAVLLVALVSGCAYIDQSLKINPEYAVSQRDIGKGKQVALRVVDDRDDQVIGKRKDGMGISGAKITTDQDIVGLIKESFKDGIKKNGFVPVGENEEGISLRVELRALAFDTSTGFWTAGNMGKSTIKVIATQSSGKIFEKTYRGEKEIRTAFVSSQETNSKVINEALGEVLTKIFQDNELWEFLSK